LGRHHESAAGKGGNGRKKPAKARAHSLAANKTSAAGVELDGSQTPESIAAAAFAVYTSLLDVEESGSKS